MSIAVVVFPGSNCEHDVVTALEGLGGDAHLVWHRETELDDFDGIVLPGGFAHGDALRTGAIARFSPVMRSVERAAAEGKPVLGICNGFQILTEAGLLPGALMRNDRLTFVCRDQWLQVDGVANPYTASLEAGRLVRFPIAHGEGNYVADDATLDRLESEGRVVFRYVDERGAATAAANPNGSARGIAGIASANGRVLGLMPHPDRAMSALVGSEDGRAVFRGLVEAAA